MSAEADRPTSDEPTAGAPTTAPGGRYGAAFWLAVAVGGLTMAWGVRFFLDHTPDWPRRWNFAVWIVGADLLHDLLLVPLLCLVGWVVNRSVPGRWRAPVQAGLIATGFVLVVAWLPLRGTASVSDNPTIQPLDYRSATLTVLAVVWLTCGTWLVARLVRRRPRESAGPIAAPAVLSEGNPSNLRSSEQVSPEEESS